MIEKTALPSSVHGRSGVAPGRPAVPWLTVVLLAVVMAFADGFWMVVLRGAVGAIERTQEPFASWLHESTAVLPLFMLAVLAALTLALRWFGPVLSRPRTVMATGLLVAGAGTLVGIAEIAASSAWDYQLQLQLMDSMHHGGAASPDPSLGQASLGLQLAALGYGSAIILVTNVVAIGWVVAIRGGRLDVSRTRQRTARSGRIDHRRLFLAAALFGSAGIHAAVVPGHLAEWPAASLFFCVLAAAELAVGLLLLGGKRTPLLAAVALSIVPLALWSYSRTAGLPFGPDAGVPETVGLADCAAGFLELGTLLAAVVLLRGKERIPGRPLASAHIRSLPVVAAIAVSVLGLAGTSPAWFDDPGNSGGGSVNMAHH
ncbi:hypothetical protein [Pseudarthrobacter albicanus]|uniref:hypothetical protein n=1 Tax=Pseudarthrobacter albicanus TaxID=2823873 RepID=UPI001BAA5E4F|nr:hypothetical protein [Pseudarthrobacter albicanus]